MKQKKRWITYLLSVVIAIMIALFITYFEIYLRKSSSQSGLSCDLLHIETILLMHFLSDGFFASAVLYLGFGILTLISEAGNFYGMQYLGYTLLHMFSFKKSDEDKKDYFSYCMKKKATQKEKGNSYFKWLLLLIGLGSLILSGIFAVLYYQLFDGN